MTFKQTQLLYYHIILNTGKAFKKTTDSQVTKMIISQSGQMSYNSITGKVVGKNKPKQQTTKPCSSLKVRQNFFVSDPFGTLAYCSAVPAQ